MGWCVLSAHLNERTWMLLLNCPYRLYYNIFYLTSSLLFVDSKQVASATAQSIFHRVSPMFINVKDLSLADRFSLIDESKDVVPARQLFSPSPVPQRASLLSDIAADQRGKKTLSICSLSLWKFNSVPSFLWQRKMTLISGKGVQTFGAMSRQKSLTNLITLSNTLNGCVKELGQSSSLIPGHSYMKVYVSWKGIFFTP